MNRPNRANNRQHGPRRNPAAADIWRTPASLDDVVPIIRVTDTGALLRSLGDPPITGGVAAGHYFAAVIDRAAAVAAALALSAELLATPRREDDDANDGNDQGPSEPAGRVQSSSHEH